LLKNLQGAAGFCLFWSSHNKFFKIQIGCLCTSVSGIGLWIAFHPRTDRNLQTYLESLNFRCSKTQREINVILERIKIKNALYYLISYEPTTSG